MRQVGARMILCAAVAICLTGLSIGAAETLPTGSAPKAIEFPHFPSRMHTFVWRNWEMISLQRMARVLGTSPENVKKVGRSMGLAPHVQPPAAYRQRGYISIIRRNWHVLPYEQLLTLLDWDANKLAFTLREDDFLWIKLGSLKPACPPLQYTVPDESEQKRCAQIKALVSTHFGEELAEPGKPRFDFMRDMAVPDGPEVKVANVTGDKEGPIRFLYSYFGVFGDPLLNPQLDPYPDPLLQRLSEMGVNGVWLHVVLRQLAPSSIFPEFGAGHQRRLANLRKMVDRAKRHGVNIYLYMNEPRAMPLSFFAGREHLKGIQRGDHGTLCTSTPEVRQWITESLRHVFEHVPGLGGVFTITGSENLTSCYSHTRDAKGCPRCSERPGPEVIAEVNRAIATGVWAGDPNAKVICWDWGWPDGTGSGWGKPNWAKSIIEKLPENVYLMSVSEWGKPIVRGGIKTAVGEYSMSTIGPGPRAQKHWALARKRGLKTIAKMQVNCSWELSAVPYIPVMNLLAEHCSNLTKAGIDGQMLSWTVGGYPSANLQLVSLFQQRPAPSVEEALTQLAESRYGPEAAPDARAAWARFSQAFSEYPFHGQFVYRGPAQYGPANLLYPEPTGYRSTMVGFPYDDVDGWRGVYPAEVLAQQFEKIATGWREGLTLFKKAQAKATGAHKRQHATDDLIVAEAAGLHFQSVANQTRFVLARNALLSQEQTKTARAARIAEIEALVTNELANAKRLFTLTRQDPRIGFEASNHYYYLPLDLVEKVVSCQHILDLWRPL